MTTQLIIMPGSPLPLGVHTLPKGVNFAVYAKTDSPVKLILYKNGIDNRIAEFIMSSTGTVYHLFVEGIEAGTSYYYETSHGRQLLDPYAHACLSGSKWNDQTAVYQPLGVIPFNQPYDWEDDTPPAIPAEELIIYEMHVRGFTQDASSKTAHPGTYLGMIEKIDHLKALGINAVELLPLFEFDEAGYRLVNPITNQPLCNYWGYNTINFFTPMNRFAAGTSLGAAQKELKDLVKALHRNGIEVILDVVYNHTGEGNEKGPVISFKGFDNSTYYLLDENGEYLNFSGCGNTFNSNNPIVRELILASLRHWVADYHIDGFRFDLATALMRGEDGTPLANAPLIEAITKDPLLANVKLIAEAWDAVGFYQVGNFYSQSKRWSEWNGIYRDTVRRFIKGTHGTKGDFATRICGSNDLYHNRGPYASVNFVTCHDGFSLADLVSYNQKHNIANGEHNQDGSSWNDSWNCGVEGPTDKPEVIALRERQMRNFMVALMVSQGIPMLNMGDEYAHTKQGNNNTWCQDNQLNWFLWNKLEENAAFFKFYKAVIKLRKTHPHFHHTSFLTDKEIQWHGLKPFKPDWNDQSLFLAFTLLHNQGNIYIAFNSNDSEVDVELPPNNKPWRIAINSGDANGNDCPDTPVQVKGNTLTMVEHSAIILL